MDTTIKDVLRAPVGLSVTTTGLNGGPRVGIDVGRGVMTGPLVGPDVGSLVLG
jgi:hypothetical protein